MTATPDQREIGAGRVVGHPLFRIPPPCNLPRRIEPPGDECPHDARYQGEQRVANPLEVLQTGCRWNKPSASGPCRIGLPIPVLIDGPGVPHMTKSYDLRRAVEMPPSIVEQLRSRKVGPDFRGGPRSVAEGQIAEAEGREARVERPAMALAECRPE